MQHFTLPQAAATHSSKYKTRPRRLGSQIVLLSLSADPRPSCPPTESSTRLRLFPRRPAPRWCITWPSCASRRTAPLGESTRRVRPAFPSWRRSAETSRRRATVHGHHQPPGVGHCARRLPRELAGGRWQSPALPTALSLKPLAPPWNPRTRMRTDSRICLWRVCIFLRRNLSMKVRSWSRR